MARKIGLRRRWFQNGRHPHYDLTVNRRAIALSFGAEEITTREWIKRMQILT